ncbi:MAG: multidrug effflux MFS transporter [Caulobacteraceae bacterium]|nr:multidrug effflux MFS transporter [Caulobacteraceae bacterium]
MHAPQRTLLTDPTPWGLVVLLGALTAMGPLAIDMYLPSLPSIARDLHASAGLVAATLAAFFAGLGCGQFIFGPLSDRIGRRPPLILGVAMFLAGAALCASAPDVWWLVAARFLQALGGSAGQVITRAAVRDRFSHQMAARVLSLLMLVMGLAPIVAPIFGGYLLVVSGWRAIFWFQTGYTVLLLIAVILAMRESHHPQAREEARGENLWGSYRRLLGDRRVIGYALSGAFNSGAMFGWIAMSSYLLIEVYGVPPQDFGWWFSANAIGFIGLSQVNAHLLRRFTPERILVWARPLSVVFAAVVVLGAFTGWGGMLGVVIPLYLTLGTFGLVGPNTQAAAMNVDPLRTGAISSIVGGFSFALGATVSAAGGYLHDGTARPFALLEMGMIVASSAALYLIAKPTAAPRAA